MSSAKISEGMLFDSNKNEPMKITDLSKNAVIHCPTQAKWNAIIQLCKNAGLNCTLDDEHYWDIYKEGSCICPYNQTSRVQYCDKQFYYNEHYIIYHAEAFLKQEKKMESCASKSIPISDAAEFSKWKDSQYKLNHYGKYMLFDDFAKGISYWAQYTIEDLVDKFIEHKTKEWAKANKWISVKDRLPELGMIVLCIDNKKWQSVCFYGNYSVDENHKFYKHDLDYYFELEDVTHWQPLPKSPTK